MAVDLKTCFVCDHDGPDLVACPIMTGEPFSKTEHVVCTFCLKAWYDPEYECHQSWDDVKKESIRLRSRNE